MHGDRTFATRRLSDSHDSAKCPGEYIARVTTRGSEEAQGCRALEDAELKPLIREIFLGTRTTVRRASHRSRDCRRVVLDVVVWVGWLVLLREMGLAGDPAQSHIQPRTTDSRHCLGYSPNLLLESLPPDGHQSNLGGR